MQGGKIQSGFTLIELLIVVLIIAILAAIAAPNFLEFQTRAKVSRVKSDTRSIVTALEAYYVDNNVYPHLRLYQEAGRQYNRGGIYSVVDLTTPIAYLSSVNIVDPFQPPTEANALGDIGSEAAGEISRTLVYLNIMLYARVNNLPHSRAKYAILSYAPDKVRGPIPGRGITYNADYCEDIETNFWYAAAKYDPTNGTVSGGDILYYQGKGF